MAKLESWNDNNTRELIYCLKISQYEISSIRPNTWSELLKDKTASIPQQLLALSKLISYIEEKK